MFPGEEKVGSIKVQHKSHIPKVTFIAAVSRPDESRNFDGKIGIWRVCVLKEAQRTTARRTKGEEYEYDVTIDHVWHQNWYTETLLPTIKQKMTWLRHEDVTVQEDGATPHTGHDTPSKLNATGREGGWNIKLVTQPAQSPDLNVNDLGFFASLESVVWKEGYESVDEMVAGIPAMFVEYDTKTLERVYQSRFKRYYQVHRVRGGNDFEVEHMGIAQRQKRGELVMVVKIDREAFNAALACWVNAEEDDEHE